MKQLLILLLLFSSSAFGQTLRDTTIAMQPLKVGAKKGTHRYDTLSISPATSTADGYATKEQVALLINTSAKANSTEAALVELSADVKALTTRVQQLEALAPGLPIPLIINSNYTLTPADNGKTIYVYTNATITLNIQGAGFKCKVIRMGTGRPRFVTSGITLRLRANFTPLSVQYQAVELEWKEGEVVIQ